MKKIIYIVASLFVLQSCRTDIDLDFKGQNESALVVEGYVTEGKPISTVKLTSTVMYNSGNVNPPATDVEYVRLKRIDILGNTTFDTLSLFNSTTGEYKTSGKYIPAVGEKYELEVKFKGEIFKAESIINRAAVVDSANYFYQPERFGTQKGYQIRYAAKDLPGKGEYFWFEKLKNGKPYWETLSDKFTIWNDLFGDNLTFPAPVLFGINPGPNTEKPDYNADKDYPYALGDTVTINCYGVDEKAYRFYNDFVQQNSSADGGALGPLFAPPMDNIRSNLYNTNPKGIKVLGLFSARGLVSTQMIIK